MTWPEFVARVEEQTRLDDSARVLDIDVDHPCIDKELDLCVLAGVNHRSLANWIFIRNPTYKRRGYLMVWHNRGRVRPRGDHIIQNHETPSAVVLTENEADKGVTWAQLRSIVESHPDYTPDLLVNTVDIDACPPDRISIEISQDWYKPSLIVRGGPFHISDPEI